MAQIAANLQRIKNGQRRYAITPRIPGGFIQPEQLQKYIDVANEFGAVLKLTASQRIMITNVLNKTAYTLACKLNANIYLLKCQVK